MHRVATEHTRIELNCVGPCCREWRWKFSPGGPNYVNISGLGKAEKSERGEALPLGRNRESLCSSNRDVHRECSSHAYSLLCQPGNQKLPNEMIPIHEHQNVSERHLTRAFEDHSGRS